MPCKHDQADICEVCALCMLLAMEAEDDPFELLPIEEESTNVYRNR
jgi:hypothetical protein